MATLTRSLRAVALALLSAVSAFAGQYSKRPPSVPPGAAIPLMPPAAIGPIAAGAAAVAPAILPQTAAQSLAGNAAGIGRAIEADASGVSGLQAIGSVFDGPFAKERVDFSPEQIERVRRTEAVLVAAIEDAMRAAVPNEPSIVRARGSTARETYITDNPDYDINVRLPTSWTAGRFRDFRRNEISEFRQRLASALEARIGSLPGHHLAASVSVAGPIPLNDPATRQPFGGTIMLPVRLTNAAGGVIAKSDVVLTINDTIANAYPEYFAAQLEQARAAQGPAAPARLLSDIRLAKRFFKEAVGAYTPWKGGPSAIGIEQMVLQSGGFDPLMEKAAAGAPWTVHNPFMQPANMLALMSEKARGRLTALASLYLQAHRQGKPLVFREIAQSAGVVPSRAAAQAAPALGGLTQKMLDRFTITGPRPLDRGDAFLYAQGAKPLPAGLEASAQAEASRSGAPDPKAVRSLLKRRGSVTVTVKKGDRQLLVDVPEALAEGIPSETLVELTFAGAKIKSLRPLGGMRADVVIGRAVNRGGQWMLEPLLNKSLYRPMPLSAQDPLAPGAIVQAFVRKADKGFAASVLLDLGPELTPEIAVREIALRHGARGYFFEDVIRQAEAAGSQEPGVLTAPERFEDLRALPFVTIDPEGAGDLDDAFHIERDAEGFTWILATADVSRYVSPGTPAFRAAARMGNSFYSIDKNGVPDYPMNHPVVSKYLASLLEGKDSYAMITRMRFDLDGNLIPEKSKVSLALVRVQGRYTYDQVAQHWAGRPGHGVGHTKRIDLARELAAKLSRLDNARGKLKLDLDRTTHVKRADGWAATLLDEDPLIQESHRLIEELKVYGNLVITNLLNDITRTTGVPQIRRAHPPQNEQKNAAARLELEELGVPWPEGQSLPQYLELLLARAGVSHEAKQRAQFIALRTRNSARYVVVDDTGHEGLALAPGQYDHPSAPIRRFSDMYNRALLETALEGGDPRALYEAILKDLSSLGFPDLESFLDHLNGREQATRQMDYEVETFMAIHELSQPRNLKRPIKGYIKGLYKKHGETLSVEIQLQDPPVTVEFHDGYLDEFAVLDKVEVIVHSADPASSSVRMGVKKAR